MEYVDGTTIDLHCQHQHLSVRRRLELFRQVCEAVHHAHQRLIVHRDIKPANILVGADGVPKLLDFGIAKLIENGRGRADTALRAFTPESASPEQTRNEPVTVASDVYSLGALLYCLLSDRKVFDFTSTSDSDMMRLIREVDPPPPSEVASRSSTQHERVARDLDWITLKALRKEAERRYASAAQLNDDCGRYLRGEPVVAAPDSTRYRAAKFLRRHWVGASAAAAIVATVAATGTAVWLARQRAERRFNEVRQLANTVIGELYDAIADVPGSTAARQLLVTRAVGYLDTLAREAGTDTSLKKDLADAYQKIGDVQGNPYGANLGDVTGARASYAKLVDLRSAVYQAQRHDRSSTLNLGRAHARLGDLDLGAAKYAQAVEAYQKAVALLDEAGPGVDGQDDSAEDRGRVLNRMGVALTWAGRRQEARSALQQAIQLTEQLVARPGATRVMRRGLAVSQANLGDVFFYEQDLSNALASHQKGVAQARVLLNEAPDQASAKRDVIMMLARVGGDLIEMKKHAEAIQATEESIALERELIKDDPANVQFQFDLSDMYANLAISQRETGRLDAALSSMELAIHTSEEAAARNPQFAAHQFNYGGMLNQLGRVQRDRHAYTEAVQAFRHSIEIFTSVPADQRDPTQLLTTRSLLGETLIDQAAVAPSASRWQEARVALDEALDAWRTYQKGAGAKEDHQADIDRLASLLHTAEKNLAR